MELCHICKQGLDDGRATATLRVKGSNSINNVSCLKKDTIHTKPGDKVHTDCRCRYIKNRETCDGAITNSSSHLRSQHTFDFKSNCLFCATSTIFSARKRSFDVYPVRSLEFVSTIKKHCIERNDAWANCVLSRLSSVIDLPAAEAVYHQTCSVNFRTGKNVPKTYQRHDDEKTSPGRPEHTLQATGFQAVTDFIDSGELECVKINDLVRIMTDVCGEQNAYSTKHMKRKVIEYYGENIVFSSENGMSDIITFKESATAIIASFHKQTRGANGKEEKKQLITTAAKLLKDDILQLRDTRKQYPNIDDISSSQQNIKYLPESLQLFLDEIITGKNISVKKAAIGQSLVQACRPKGVIAPLQIGLAVQIHHLSGSRLLVDTLHSMGLCSSYREVQMFEANAAVELNTNIPVDENSVLQFIADNVDHNIRTLDGNGTFHGMGIIAVSAPAMSQKVHVRRNDICLEDLVELGRISIEQFIPIMDRIVEPVRFKPIDSIAGDNCGLLKDTFSHLLWPVHQGRPLWSGFMQMFNKKIEHPGPANITFMPMIDLNPSDLTCINTTLHFVSQQAKRYQRTPIVTFDQPLFQKAWNIINQQSTDSPLRDIVLRLGGFHSFMSFLGCIGHLMSNTGLRECIETVYASNAVVHMMSGKAIQRAIRAHILVADALHVLWLETTSGHNIVTKEEYDDNEPDEVDENGSVVLDSDTLSGEHVPMDTTDTVVNLQELASIYDHLVDGSSTLEDATNAPGLNTIMRILNDGRRSLVCQRTAKLWLQYLDMVSILLHFIRAERTGDWRNHLLALRRMLPYFASCGHNMYLKSAYLYLQQMIAIEQTHPNVYNSFMEGHHAIRRSDRYWAGLSSDLVIEQALMRALKTTGGLTRGRGMTEQQRSLWLFSMPLCVAVNSAMQTFSEVNYETSEQHKEVGKSRVNKDQKDTYAIYGFLTTRNPFRSDDTTLRNIETGVAATADVNVDSAKEVGEEILSAMIGQDTDSFKFKRASQVIALSDHAALKVTGEPVQIDTQLLFQRLLAASHRYVNDISEIFQYELCSIPSSLFDKTGLPREAQKSSLGDAIWKQGDCKTVASDSKCQPHFVVDGGSLVQKCMWEKGRTFQEICDQYTNFISSRYACATVVFDGYLSGPSTKDVTHYRRTKGKVGTHVSFCLETTFRTKKDIFLQNVENKQNFIIMLGEYLSRNDVGVVHAPGDADCSIVTTALTLAESIDVVVIGEDTDLLVLLCHHYKESMKEVTFRSDSRRNSKTEIKVWDIRSTANLLGVDLCYSLPFLHALSGCDTTSRIYGISKPATLKLFRTNSSFRTACHKFIHSESKEDIIRNGECVISSLYEPSLRQGLDSLRYRKFAAKVASSMSTVQVHTLPPTSDAARFHSLRVYHQTWTWMEPEQLVDALEYGWELKEQMLIPTKSTMPPAPSELLKAIRCTCKSCDSKRCTCKKHGLDCSFACRECRGVACSNAGALSDLDQPNDID